MKPKRKEGFTYEILERREGHEGFVGVGSWDSFTHAFHEWSVPDGHTRRRRMIRVGESGAGILFECWIGMMNDKILPYFNPPYFDKGLRRHVEKHYGPAGWMPIDGDRSLASLCPLLDEEHRVWWGGGGSIHRVSTNPADIDGRDPSPDDMETWITKARAFVRVADMTADHIGASMHMLARRLNSQVSLGPTTASYLRRWLQRFTRDSFESAKLTAGEFNEP